jgi:hypothetical protein
VKAKNDQKPNVKNPSLLEGQADHQVHDHVGEWPGPNYHQTDVNVYAQYTQVTAHHHHHVAHLEEALSRCLRLTHTSVPDVERNILASLFKITVTTEMIARYNSTEAPPAPSSSSNPGQH